MFGRSMRLSESSMNSYVDAYGDQEIYDDAKEIVISHQKCSISFLQRKLRIEYGRGAALVDALEEAGVVGPHNGAKPREVLIKPK